MPNIQYIDTTLREGLQSAIPPFKQGTTPTTYAQAASEHLQLAFAEIYGPEVYYPVEEYDSLISTLGSRLQLYCGPIDKFDFDKKPHLKTLDAPRLSFTIIHKNTESLDKLQHVLKMCPSATLRVGLECAGSGDKSGIIQFIKDLDGVNRIKNITLSDSNGAMTPDTVRKLVTEVPRLKQSTLGFHLHNDKGLATANAIAAIEAAANAKHKNISLDYTFYGLGERYGLLSLQELAASGQEVVIGKVREEIRNLSELFSDEASRFHSLPYMRDVVHVAASHFDANGNLRPEYRTDN
jgi:isopropylmalate/homocitrate/citramalate synthase